MNLIIERLNGQVFDFSVVGIGIRDFVVSSPTYSTSYVKLEGMPGEQDIGTEMGARIIRASLYFEAERMEDYADERDELFAIFRSEEAFYLIDTRSPGKRWKVKTDGFFEPDQHGIHILFDVVFKAASGVSETRLNKEKTFSEPIFQFKNEGNVQIDMKHQIETEIEFIGSSTGLEIRNKTTGDVWKYNGSTGGGDRILLKGVQSLKNGNSIFGQTNFKLISFAPGWNDIEVRGATVFTLKIRTRFYFL